MCKKRRKKEKPSGRKTEIINFKNHEQELGFKPMTNKLPVALKFTKNCGHGL